MLVECKSCGAPLDVRSGQRIVRCAYCRANNRVAEMNALAGETPADWEPPKEWQGRGSVRPLPYRPRRARWGLLVALLGVLLGAFSCVLAVLFIGDDEVYWGGQEPFRCGGNDTVVIRGVNANLAGVTAITASENCSVRVIDSHITAHVGVRATGNRDILLERTILETTGPGVHAEGNRVVDVQGGRIVSGGFALDLHDNASATVTGATVEGSPAPTSTSGNARVEWMTAPPAAAEDRATRTP